MKNLIVSENKALIFNFLKKKTTKKKLKKKHAEDIFSRSEKIEIFVIKFCKT